MINKLFTSPLFRATDCVRYPEVDDRRGCEVNSKAYFEIGVILVSTVSAVAQPRAIDTEKSTLTVRVYKSGVLSAFGHDHEIAAPIAGGTVDAAAHHVELHVKAGSLRVADSKVSDKDRAEIQQTMLGPEVLDAERHSEISFISTSAEPAGAGSWMVQGNLTLHGRAQPVTVAVRETNGRDVGDSRFKQSDFGIKPVKVAGGSIGVKDEVRIELNIQLVR
jgi:polyisoprenoid-binding protein YceI